ncbi:MAG: lamin tail domain-containing protein [Verrucomicrobia bacterium]|nr:lamin tail domain-containing protein [Verrucomicrobiota bacterium]
MYSIDQLAILGERLENTMEGMMKKVIIVALMLGMVASANAELIITMVMDGDVSSTPRFVEVYNNGVAALDLGDYRLANYANGASTGSASTLAGSLSAGSFAYLMATTTSQANFESLYGLGLNIVNAAQVSSNGDDVYALRNAGGDILDVFGVVGVDGTGYNWEHTDASFYRLDSNLGAHTDFTYANPALGASGVGLLGWSYTSVDGMLTTTDDYAGTAPIGQYSPIPEPGSFALVGMGLAAVLMIRRRLNK